MRARSAPCLHRRGGRSRRRGFAHICAGPRHSQRDAERSWPRPAICGPTAQQPSISGSTTGTTAGDGRTIGPRIRISRPDGGSARCNASRARAQPRSSSQSTPPSTTLSTSNAISRQLNLIACSRRGDDHVARGRRGGLKMRRRRPLALFTWQRDNAVREPTSASILQDHDAFSAHENEISGRQNQETATPGYALSFASTEFEAKPV